MRAIGLVGKIAVAMIPFIPKSLLWRIAKRYVAGEDILSAIEQVKRLNSLGIRATIDILGEEVTDREKVKYFLEEYKQLVEKIHTENLNSGISVKPSMLGLRIDEEFMYENFEKLTSAAADASIFVRIDMEDSSATTPTIKLYKKLKERFDNVGVVLQAYLRRTLLDIAELPENSNVRLCKGIYDEPPGIAWQLYESVRANFLASLNKLFSRGFYVGIATHDELLIVESINIIDKLKKSRNDYEFQMLYGVRQKEAFSLVRESHPLRVYVPFGKDWYPYTIRRLRENPEIAGYILRAVIKR